MDASPFSHCTDWHQNIAVFHYSASLSQKFSSKSTSSPILEDNALIANKSRLETSGDAFGIEILPIRRSFAIRTPVASRRTASFIPLAVATRGKFVPKNTCLDPKTRPVQSATSRG